jgi:hypothetical protein
MSASPPPILSAYLGRAARASINEAQRQASARGDPTVGAVHMLLGVCLAAGLQPALEARGVDMANVLRAIQGCLSPPDAALSDAGPPRSTFGQESIALLSAAAHTAQDQGTFCISAIIIAQTVLSQHLELARELAPFGFTAVVLGTVTRADPIE